MVVYGLAAEYVYNDVVRTDTEEEETSRAHLFTVMKGIGCSVFGAWACSLDGSRNRENRRRAH